MDRERLDYWCERGILGLVLGILIFAPLATGAVRTLEFLVVQALTLGVLVLWTVRFWTREGHRILWAPICWAVLAFIILAIVRYHQAPVEYAARQELIRILVYGVLFFAILDNLNRQETTQWLAFALILLGTLLSLYAVYQFLTNSPYVWHFVKPAQYMRRGSGTYICPNHLAGFLEMILPVSLAFTLIGRFAHTTKVFLGYASLAILAGIGVSLSRGGWLATGLSLVLFFALLLWYRKSRLPAMIFFVVIVGAAGYFLTQTMTSKKRIDSFFYDGNFHDIRLRLWKPAYDIWQQHFWFGGGPAQFDWHFRLHRPPDIQMRPMWAHNDYLNAAADWGLVGMVIIGTALGLLFYGVLKTWKFVHRSNDINTKPSNRAAFVFGATVGLVAILLHSFVDFNMQIPANAMVAITLMALLTGHIRFATERFWVKPGLMGRLLMTLLAGMAFYYLGGQWLTRAQEHKQLARADAVFKTDGAAYLEALKRAHEIEPNNGETTYRIGEYYRLQSWQGYTGYALSALEAMNWFARGMKINPLDSYNYLRYGMCLDWLGRNNEATAYYERALELDPRDYYVVALRGWHSMQTKDFVTAKKWLEKSAELKLQNEVATTYLRIVERRLAAGAAQAH